MKRVFLGGEGPNDLGAGNAIAGDDNPEGVVHALLSKAQVADWKIVGTRRWKDIRKLKVGQNRDAERQNVLGIHQHAREAQADVLVFCRDQDDDSRRARTIQAAVLECRSPTMAIVGAVAVLKLESWILAIRGEVGSESLPDAEGVLTARFGVAKKATAQMVNCVLHAPPIKDLPSDALSLRAWLAAWLAAFGQSFPK